MQFAKLIYGIHYAQWLSPTDVLANIMMDDNRSIIKDLSQLEKMEYRKLSQPTPFLRVGFNQKRKPFLRRLNPLHPQPLLEGLIKAEQQLTRDIKQIDQMLQKQHAMFKYHNGYLFAQGTGHDLVGGLQKIIKMRTESVEHGFAIWRVYEQEGNVQLMGGKLGCEVKPFGDRLTQKSLQKLQLYSSKKNKQSLKQSPKPWQYFSRLPQQYLRIKTTEEESNNQIHVRRMKMANSRLRQQTEMNRKYTNNLSSFNQSQINQSLLELRLNEQAQEKSGFKGSRNLEKDIPFGEINPRANREEIQKMFAKQNRILSIWTPPANYPQLLAVFSVQIREKQLDHRACWLNKYFITKHCLNRRLANCMLDWASHQFGLIDELVATASKQVFESIFAPEGWKVSSWISQSKMRIVYRRTLI